MRVRRRVPGGAGLRAARVLNRAAAACQVSAMPTFKVFRDKKEVGMIRGADPNGLRALIQQHAGDKWSVAGEGQSLGSGQDTGGMSEREKRLAALERRGL